MRHIYFGKYPDQIQGNSRVTKEQLADLTQPQRDRLSFIELRLRFFGDVRRQDLVTRFGIQTAAATRDLSLYREMAPRNLEYDKRTKLYARSEWFVPVFEFSADRVLTWLAHGFGDSQPLQYRQVVPCEVPAGPNQPNLDVLSAVTRAIHGNRLVEIAYRALTTGLTTRVVAPFALATDGLRWHTRAFDRRSKEFRDFVLTRMADARLVEGEIKEHEVRDKDIQWNRIVELELVPHPANIQHPDAIEADYGMENGVLKLPLRAALAGYVLRRWNVDCSEKHNLKGPEYHLWLRNRQALYGVGNLLLAPGYELKGAA